MWSIDPALKDPLRDARVGVGLDLEFPVSFACVTDVRANFTNACHCSEEGFGGSTAPVTIALNEVGGRDKVATDPESVSCDSEREVALSSTSSHSWSEESVTIHRSSVERPGRCRTSEKRQPASPWSTFCSWTVSIS